MTTDDILTRWNAATARERDLWVLEVVMGWRWWAVPCVGPAPYRTLRMVKPPQWTPAQDYSPSHAAKILPLDPPDYSGVEPFSDADRNVPRVSTSRADVWRVVDAMREKGYLLRLFAWLRDWRATFRGSTFAEQVHVCEAICLAALLAVLREV